MNVYKLTEQLRMGACAVKNHFFGPLFDAIYEKPIRFNMTLPLPLVFPMQRVVFMLWQKRLFIKKQTHYFIEFVHVLILFYHELTVFLKRTCKSWIQHCLIVSVQVHNHFLKGIVPFCGNFTAKHGVSFFNCGDGFGIRPQCPALGIAILGAKGTFMQGSFRSRGKGKNSPSSRYFFGHVNNQAPVSRYVYGLCNGHNLNIA